MERTGSVNDHVYGASVGRPLRSTRLPVPLTTLLAREHEMAELAALLRRPDVRILTLTGPGGVGKTRLAVVVANELLASTRDAVVFVSLAPIRDLALVPSAVAHTLGIVESGTRSSAEAIAEVIGAEKLLLVLDNYCLLYTSDAADEL